VLRISGRSALIGRWSYYRSLVAVPVFCSEFPCAPPPSRCKSAASLVDDDDPLVHIKLKLVDQNCPQFVSKHNSVSRFHPLQGLTVNLILVFYNECLSLTADVRCIVTAVCL